MGFSKTYEDFLKKLYKANQIYSKLNIELEENRKIALYDLIITIKYFTTKFPSCIKALIKRDYTLAKRQIKYTNEKKEQRSRYTYQSPLRAQNNYRMIKNNKFTYDFVLQELEHYENTEEIQKYFKNMIANHENLVEKVQVNEEITSLSF